MARSFEACGKTAERYSSYYKSLPIFLIISGFWQCEELLSSSMQFWIGFHSFIVVQINTLSIIQRPSFVASKLFQIDWGIFRDQWTEITKNALISKKYIA